MLSLRMACLFWYMDGEADSCYKYKCGLIFHQAACLMNLCIPITWDSQGTKSLEQGRGDRVPAVPTALLGLACPVGKAPDGIERKEFFSAVRVGRKTGEKSRRFGKGRHILFVFKRKSRAPFSRPAFHFRSPPHLFSRKPAHFIQEMRIRKLPVHIHGQLRFLYGTP